MTAIKILPVQRVHIWINSNQTAYIVASTLDREGIAKTIKSCAVVAEGAAAYAALRAATERALQVKFQHTWSADHDESLLETDKEDTSAADIYYMESDDEEFGRVENDEEFDVD